ncbi:MAG TPA: hypothetical protein DCG26_01890 [Alphaproteobacteria bacterium]|nr:hypothetical protein [Alphaproteobacteria bacterium]
MGLWGTVLAEAWFAGVPLVATRADGARQYVTHEQDGLLLDIDDLDGLVQCLDRAANDQALRKALVSNGQKTYDELFSKQVVIDNLIASYSDMIARHKNGR